MYCKKCGKQLNEEVNFCDSCGTKIGETKDYKSLILEKVKILKSKFQNLESKKAKRLIIVLGTVVILMIGMFFMRSTPEKSVEKYYQNISKGNFRTAAKYIYHDMSKKEFNETLEEELEYIKELERENGGEIDFTKFDVGEVTVLSKNKDICVVSVIISADGIPENGNILLKKQDGRWKIDFESADIVNGQ